MIPIVVMPLAWIAPEQGPSLRDGEEPSVQAAEVVQVAEQLDPDRLIQAARLDRGETGRRD